MFGSAKMWAIVQREYLQRVRSRWFIIGTLIVPALMIAVVLVPIVFPIESEEERVDFRIGLLDESEELAPGLIEELVAEGISARMIPSLPEVPAESLGAALLDTNLDAVLELPRGALDSANLVLLSTRRLSRGERAALRDAIGRDVVRARLREVGVRGVSPEELLRSPGVNVVELGPDPRGRADDAAQAVGIIFAMLLYTLLIIYGQMVTRSVLEEKTSDIVEIMVSSVRPSELMAGKIVGVGAVGLTQFSIWAAMGALMAAYGLAAAAPMLAQSGIDISGFAIPAGLLLMALIFFVLGYLLYAGLFAAGGAMLSNEQDVQQVMMPIVILIIVPVILLTPTIETPNDAWAVATSLVPFFSPILMLARVSVTQVPAWQLALALLLLVMTIVAITWAAGRIYRVGILMKGKRPNLPELWRWVRHG
jgi:ABC-2 type transport system permease protein